MGENAPTGATLLRLARETGATMDRLLVEGIGPEELVGDAVLDLFGSLSGHWQDSLRVFATVQAKWLGRLQEWNRLDAAARRNRLFDFAAESWKRSPPGTPMVAAGVTSAAPSLARLLRVVADLDEGAVILPDFDLTMPADVWDELGRAGAAPEPGDTPFARDDAVSHPQYHLKLLLNRMGVAREEVQPWHRKGLAASPPELGAGGRRARTRLRARNRRRVFHPDRARARRSFQREHREHREHRDYRHRSKRARTRTRGLALEHLLVSARLRRRRRA